MSGNRLAITVYRALLRSCKELDATVRRAEAKTLFLRLPIEDDAWTKGVYKYYPPGSDYHKQALQKLFPNIPQPLEGTCFTLGALRDCVGRNFRVGADVDTQKGSDLLDQALEALRILAEQRKLAECSSTALTDGIMVEATSSFLGKVPASLAGSGKERWLWTYRCRIENQGDAQVQLWGRHWIILDSSCKVVSEVPYGSQGVIGKQPVLDPGSSFEYYSGAELESSRGVMQGSFQCVTLSKEGLPLEQIEARIKPFRLLSPMGPA